MQQATQHEGATPGDVSTLLRAWTEGDRQALGELTPIVYDELRRLARHYMKGERPGHSLQSTALVHEAYMRLVDYKHMQWHFVPCEGSPSVLKPQKSSPLGSGVEDSAAPAACPLLFTPRAMLFNPPRPGVARSDRDSLVPQNGVRGAVSRRCRTVFEKLPILQVFEQHGLQADKAAATNQLNLFKL